jgi:hypothetical protein
MSDAPGLRLRRLTRWLFAGTWVVICLGAGMNRAFGLDDSARDDPDESALAFPAEAEPKFAELIKKMSDSKRKIWRERMSKEIVEIMKASSAPPESAKKLEAVANECVDRSVQTWAPKTAAFLRRSYAEQGEQIVEMLDEIIGQAENYARQDWVSDFVLPIDDPGWNQALQRTLTPEQLSLWTAAREEHRNVVAKEIKQFLTPSVERNREQFNTLMQARTGEIQMVLGLPKERADQLEKMASVAVDGSAAAWRKRAEKLLFAADDDSRRQSMKSGMLYLPAERADLPYLQTSWKEGVAKFLAPEEQRQLEKAAEEKKARRVVALGAILIAEFDQRIAFTAAQREKLRPIAERLVAAHRLFFPEGGFNQYINYAPQSFFTAGAKATEVEMKNIIDPLQWKRWQELCTNKPRVASRKPAAVQKVSTRIPEPEEIENRISDYLYEKSGIERSQLLSGLLLRVEDVTRVANLGPEAIARLQTAARGAAEELLNGWKASMEQSIRASVREATPQTVMQRLSAMEISYSQRGRVVPEQKGLWAKTVKNELNDAQRAAWEKEIADRNSYRDTAAIGAVMTEFDRGNSLTAEQWKALEPLVTGVMKEYGPEIGGMFSSSNSIPWYLQYYTTLIPFVGIPEEDLKKVLRKEQWERWIASGEYSNCKNYWENIQNNHAQRAKAQKQ